MRARRTTVAALLALGACGGGERGPDYVPLPLTEEQVLRTELLPLTRVSPGAEPERFTFEGERHRFADSTEALASGVDGALLIWGKGVVRAKVAGPFEPASFNVVRLSTFAWSRSVFTVQLVRAGEVVMSGRRLRAKGGKELLEVTFEFPELERETEPIDEVWVVFAEKRRPLSVGVVGLELVRRPLLEWLPTPAAPAFVEIGADARPAVGLSSDRGIDLPGVSGRLTFDYGVPLELAARAGTPELVLRRITDAGEGQVLGRWPVEPEAGWRSVAVEVDLADTLLRFQLVQPGPDRVVAAVANVALRAPVKEPRTVLLVTSDTHRADHLGCADGGVDVETPFLDALAARGLRFSDCYSATNITNPSHGSLFSGLHPRDTGVVDNSTPLAERAETLAERFRDAGFLTYAVLSSPHLRDESSGLGQGFQRVGSLAERDRVGGETIAQLERWLADAEGQPLFVWVHLYDAHAPYTPPAPYDGKYWPEVIDPYSDELPAPPSHRLPAWDRDVRELDYLAAQYRAEVSYVDHLLEGLLGNARFASAVTCVTADHGESLGGHEIWFDHQGLFPSTLAIPMILAGPGVPRGETRDAPARLADLGRTLLDLAGLEEAPFPGTSLLADAPDRPRFALAGHGHSAAVRSGDWFLVLNLVEHRENRFLPPLPAHQVRLFDLAQDPRCLMDVSGVERDRAAALRGALVRWLAAAPEARLRADEEAVVDAGREEQLARLGYAPGAEGSGAGVWFESDDCEWCTRFAE